MPRKSREEEITKAIREYLEGAVKSREPITDVKLMEASGCARATYYKYVTKGSAIYVEIENSRAEQKKYATSKKRSEHYGGADSDVRKRLEEAKEANRNLLALISQMTANLIRYGVPSELIQRAQREAMPHPNRAHSHAGRGRRRN
jgi:hypothetical protein